MRFERGRITNFFLCDAEYIWNCLVTRKLINGRIKKDKKKWKKV